MSEFKFEKISRICPKCGNPNYMRRMSGRNVGEIDIKCINCLSYFKSSELYGRILDMEVRCELFDYSNRDKAYDNPRVIVNDAGCDGDMVEITIGDKTVKVAGKELIEATNRCMRANYPYI